MKRLYGYGYPRRLLGATSTQGILAGGSPIQFDFMAVADSVAADGTLLFDPAAIAPALESAGWITVPLGSYVMGAAGASAPPQVRVTGTAVTSYSSGQDFANILADAIAVAGFPIDASTAQLTFVPYAPTGGTQSPVVTTQPPPKGFFDQIATSLGVTTGTAQLLIIGGFGLFIVLMATGGGKGKK